MCACKVLIKGAKERFNSVSHYNDLSYLLNALCTYLLMRLLYRDVLEQLSIFEFLETEREKFFINLSNDYILFGLERCKIQKPGLGFRANRQSRFRCLRK